MAVCGFDRIYLAVLVFQKGFYTYVIDRNDPGVEADIQALIQAEKDFWAHVVNGEAPTVDGSESTSNTLKQLHQSDESVVVDLCDFDEKLDEIQELKEQQKELKARQKKIENELKEILINYDFGQSSIYNVSAKVKLDEIQELKEQQKELKARQKKIENELKEILINYDFGQSSIYNVSAKVTTSSRFDTDRFKKENLKIYNSYKKETQTQTLRINRRKDI